MRLPVRALPLAALIVGTTGIPAAVGKTPETPANGPASDYPVVIGAPFVIAGTTYTPSDRLNSDEVGFASVAEAGGSGASAAHKTLPLPSYAEVTALDSGKTILVRIERRGPMSNDLLIELSADASAQLGLAGARTPVRVRRVNPPEQERAMLRAGGPAPARMETPKGLLAALARKLGAAEPSGVPARALASQPVAGALSRPEAAKPAAPTAMPAAVGGKFEVQVAAFSSEDRAKTTAGKLDGKVSKPGRFWLTRLGPFGTRPEAEAALAKARSAGYSDARIQRAD